MTYESRQPIARRAASFMCLSLSLLVSVQTLSADEAIPLTMAKAAELALASDPVVAASVSRAEALEADAVADSQLPDPKFRTGLYNVPLDDFDLGKTPTTQWRLGVLQSFPRGDTLEYKSLKTKSQSRAERFRAEAEKRKILRDVRKTYLDAYYQVAAEKIIRGSRKLFENLTEITQVQYGSGGSSQQDVLRAELELSRLDDRINKVQMMEDSARARLSKWIGEAAWQPLDNVLPKIPEPPSEKQLAEALEQHPEIDQQTAKVEMWKQNIGIAREQYKPGWSVGAEYRKRFGDNPDGSNREDMAAVMLTVDMPVFTDKRQDKRLSASQKRASAASLDRVNTMRKLRERLTLAEANRKRLNERLERYERRLLNEAEENADSALQAYQSGTIEFTGLMRARITELEIHIQALKLRVELMKTKADLLYLAAGEEK